MLASAIPILSGRSDKRFINDKACSKYHYNKWRNKARIFRKIDKQMHLNHEILEKYYEETKGEKDTIYSKLSSKHIPFLSRGKPLIFSMKHLQMWVEAGRPRIDDINQIMLILLHENNNGE